MIKRVNFTGRRRVSRRNVAIEVYDGQPRSFSAAIDLTGYNFISSASVVLEATCAGSNIIRRFDFGQVAEVQHPKNSVLEDLHGENVFFSLKVIDRTERFGRILGIAENIRPVLAGKQTATGRRGILPVERVSLGQELWQLDFREHDVFLLVNEDVREFSDRIGHDAQVYAILYPDIIRTILNRAVEEGDPDEDDDRWPVLWLNFGRKVHSAHEAPPTPDESDACEEWVEDVVDEFCKMHQLKDKFRASLPSDDWD